MTWSYVVCKNESWVETEPKWDASPSQTTMPTTISPWPHSTILTWTFISLIWTHLSPASLSLHSVSPAIISLKLFQKLSSKPISLCSLYPLFVSLPPTPTFTSLWPTNSLSPTTLLPIYLFPNHSLLPCLPSHNSTLIYSYINIYFIYIYIY